MRLKTCCVLVAVVALPVVFEATLGCSFHPGVAPVFSNSYVCSCDCEPPKLHRDMRVSAALDDAEQLSNDAVDLDLGTTVVGVRFANVQIPQNAPILSASIQFAADTSFGGDNSVATNLDLFAVADDNIPSFASNSGVNLGALPRTGASVGWIVPPWSLNELGPAQLTPNLNSVIQEIVNRGGWQSGNALAIILAGSGRREAVAYDGNPGRAALLSIDYLDPLANLEVLQHLDVCVPSALNANVGGGTPSDADLVADCGDGTLTGGHRVQDTVTGLASACNYPSQCVCNAISGSSVHSYTCDADTGNGPGVCSEVPVTASCSNFDPPDGIVSATNATGNSPVCGANSALAATLFGRKTSCDVQGTAQVRVDDDTESSDASGLLEFVGDPCPGQSCAVAVKYHLDIGSVTFGNFFHSETFSDLGGIGESVPGGEAMLSPGGDGSLAPNAAGVSAEGRRGGGALKGLAATNDDAVNLNVGWGSPAPTCALNGAILGTVDPELKKCDEGPDAGKVCNSDSDCAQVDSCSDSVCNCVSVGNSDITLSLDVSGPIVNQPPTADAGADQAVECTNAAVTNIVLDGTGSGDPDSNLRLFSWLRGNRVGPQVGFDERSTVEQSLGSQSYVLRVIDALGQSDEDTTVVNVVDTTPPVLTCSTMTSVLTDNNHDLVGVGLTGSAIDQCEGALPVTVDVFSDEDDDTATGDGKFSPDAKGIAVDALRLRAERKGNGDGRVYLIIVEATDSSGNRGSDCCVVSVPHSNSAASRLVAQTQAASVQAYCRAHAGTPPAGYFVIGDGPVLGPKQ